MKIKLNTDDMRNNDFLKKFKAKYKKKMQDRIKIYCFEDYYD